MKTDLSPRNDSLIEEENPSQSSLSTSSISFYPHTSGNSSSEEISDDFKKILYGRVAAGASLAMIIGGIVLPLYGVYSQIEQKKMLSLVFIIAVANLILSALLLIKNSINQANRPEEDFQQDLIVNAYFYGFFLGSIVTAIIFLISAAIGAGIQSRLDKELEKTSNFFRIAGGIVFGLIALVIKFFELTFSTFSNLMGANIVWLVLTLLIFGGAFTTITMIAKKDTTTAKWVGGTGAAFLLTAIICGLLYVTIVPQENRDIISTL